MSNPWIQRVSQNWKAGFTVSLISIPLSISLAIASGAPPTTGLITAVWAGLIAALFGGSNYNVVGPAGALSGILAAYALLHGADTLAMVAFVAGVLILISWIFRLERFLVFVPGSTIHGFTLSVAIIIALNQLNAALGLSGLEKHEQFLLNIWETLQHIGNISIPAFITFAGGLIFLFASLKLTPKIPGAITIAPIGILLGYATTHAANSFSLATVGTTYPNLSTSLFNFPHITFNQDILVTGVAVAFVAILETMLSAKIADGMTKTTYNERKEMLGLGLANLASGAAGGLPATGVLVRTALNVRTGATHKIASGINAILVGVFSLILFHWFSYLPMAIIAAILVFAAIRMVGAEHFVRYFKYDRIGFALAMLVTAVSLYKDPTMGLLVGIGASLLVFMEKLSRGQCELVVNTHTEGPLPPVHTEGGKLPVASGGKRHILVYSIKGQLAYINSQAHLTRFRDGCNGYDWIVLRLRELYFIDTDGIDALAEIIDLMHQQGLQVAISGVNEFTKQALEQLPAFQKLESAGLVFPKTQDALTYIKMQHPNSTSTDQEQQ